MSTNPQPGKQSRWGVGSFFQQAVAGVESRLDTILAEPDEEPAKKDTEKASKQDEQPALQPGMSFNKPTSDTPSRSPSTKANDRLQERLARAVVRRNSQGNAGSPMSSTGVPSRAASPYAANDGRTSLDSSAGAHEDGTFGSTKGDNISIASGPRGSMESVARSSKDVGSDRDSRGRPSQEQSAERETKPATEDGTDTTRDIPEIGVIAPPSDQGPDYEAAMAKLQADHEASELRWQEELHEYTERIDALQSKVKYLAKEAAESAKNAAASAEPGSMERKLLEKDEQIANLMEEGQKLSKTELDHRTTIKKLRQYIAENTKSQESAKKKTEKLEKDLSAAQDRAKRAETLERQSADKLTGLSKKEKQLESVTAERNASNAAISDLKDQLAKAITRAEAAERKAQTDSVEAERRQVAELKDDLSSAKIEREISEEKLRREIKDLKEGIEREKERARVLEIELRNEQSVLESKMESLRSRAEEASSSATGDAQAKLLRQIETLQTQYAVASENWHGIEGSLVSRLSGVEAERDDIARREGDLRRKLRETSLKAKRSEGDVENTREVIRELEQNLEESKQKVEKLTQRIAKADEDLATTKQELKKQQEIVELTVSQRLEEERSKWQEQALASPHLVQQAHTESPVASLRKASYEPIGTPSDRPTSRRSSTLPLPLSELSSPPRQGSYSSLKSNIGLRHSSFADASAASDVPMHLSEPEEYFNSPATPITPSAQGTHTQHSRGINDIISVSTVGAGPSVQLVERMSATVRRLESERAASKDELARLTSQRDEARQEVVELMREVEEKRDGDKKVQELESKLEDLDQRYQTTLEMLGEKSEQVEELKADIADVKKIYRELVDSTMK